MEVEGGHGNDRYDASGPRPVAGGLRRRHRPGHDELRLRHGRRERVASTSTPTTAGRATATRSSTTSRRSSARSSPTSSRQPSHAALGIGGNDAITGGPARRPSSGAKATTGSTPATARRTRRLRWLDVRPRPWWTSPKPRSRAAPTSPAGRTVESATPQVLNRLELAPPREPRPPHCPPRRPVTVRPCSSPSSGRSWWRARTARGEGARAAGPSARRARGRRCPPRR